MGGIRKGGIKAAIKSAPKRKVSSVKKGGVKSGGGYKKATVSKPKKKVEKKPVGSNTRQRVISRDLAESGYGSSRGKNRQNKRRGGFALLDKRNKSRAAAGKGGFVKPNPSKLKPVGSKFRVLGMAQEDNKIQ